MTLGDDAAVKQPAIDPLDDKQAEQRPNDAAGIEAAVHSHGISPLAAVNTFIIHQIAGGTCYSQSVSVARISVLSDAPTDEVMVAWRNRLVSVSDARWIFCAS